MSEPLRVLCVDDDPQAVDVTESYLERELDQVTVLRAVDGDDALSTLDAEPVDCVVSDHDMPGTTGLELLRTVRARHPELPFVLFTGKGSEEVASDAVSAGVTDYIQKAGSEKFELLANRIADAIGQRRTERDLAATHRKLQQLHETALTLRTVDDPETVFEHAAEAAEEVLAFDVFGLFTLEEGQFAPVALRNFEAEIEPMTPEEGIVGRTFRTGESALVDDVTEDPDASPSDEGFRACISVAVGDHGVFQAISETPGAFDERDLELAELLVAHVAGALDRIAYQGDLETMTDRLEALLANTTANIYIKDLEGRYRLVNDAFADQLGMNREAVVGRTDEELQPRAVAEEVRENDRRAIEQRRAVEVEESADWDGDERIYYSVKAPLLDDGGEPWGVCGVSSDITALKDNERELERKTERLETFASVVSHDLRNPLSVAKGHAEMLVEQGHEGAAEVDAALDRMAAIIDDLLSLAREGRAIGDTTQVAVAEVAETAWEYVQSDGASLVVESERTVEADPGRLCQAFENLFRNAVEHGAGNDAHAAEGLTVGLVDTDSGFAVVDDGVGFPAEDVLAPGTTTSDRGTGVGLAIVERIVDAHGWSLRVCNDDGARVEVDT
jgi:PAS domain S-box-containing protein